MAELKTQRTGAAVGDFLESVDDDLRRRDAHTLCALLTEVTGEPPEMWGSAIVGFGHHHLRYDSGRELEWMLVGFSPRKAATTLYVMDGFDDYHELLGALGPHRTGTSCLYLKRLDAVDHDVLRELVRRSVAAQRAQRQVVEG